MRFVCCFALAAMVAGCSGSKDFTCTSSTVLDKVGDLSRQQLRQVPTMAFFDHEKTSFRVEDIRQQSGNDRSLVCAANLYADVTPLAAGGAASSTDINGIKAFAAAFGKQALDITYTVEKLDKGGFYITVRGL